MPFFPFIDLDIVLSVYRLSIPILTIGPASHLNLHSRPAVANALECALIFTFTLTDPPHDVIRPLVYERMSLPLCTRADTPFISNSCPRGCGILVMFGQRVEQSNLTLLIIIVVM